MAARQTPESGFTLVEAMVALVILSLSLAGIFGLINTDLISLRRAEAVVSSQNALQEAVRRLQLETLSDGASGSLQIGKYECFWSSRLVEPITVGRSSVGGIGVYDHGLYQVDLALYSESRSLGVWTLRLVQYERVRQLESETI